MAMIYSRQPYASGSARVWCAASGQPYATVINVSGFRTATCTASTLNASGLGFDVRFNTGRFAIKAGFTPTTISSGDGGSPILSRIRLWSKPVGRRL